MEKEISNVEPIVLSVNISKGGIPKHPVDNVFVKESGLEGDGHDHEKHYRLEQAVCLQDVEKLEELKDEGYPLSPGATGENLTVKDLNVNELPLGTVLEFTSGLILELSKVRKPCYVLDEINPQLKEDIRSRCGLYAKVIKEGNVHQFDKIKVVVKPS